MNWLIDSKGFHWTQNGPPKSEPVLRFRWKNDLSGSLEPGDTLPHLDCTPIVTAALKTNATALLLNEGNHAVETENGRILLVRDVTRFGIAFLSDALPSWRRSQLSIIDLAQLVEQLYPARIESFTGNNKQIVIAAPHAPSETGTAALTEKLAKALSCGHVIAWGYRDRGDRFIPHAIGRFINVNRPIERVRNGAGKRLEIRTPRAEAVFAEYRDALKTVGGGFPLQDLVEVHGFQKRIGHNADIEIATTGWEKQQLSELKKKFTKILHSHDHSSDVLVEPIDTLSYNATDTKAVGSLQSSITQRSLHIEFSVQIRQPKIMNHLIEALTEFLSR